jgi:hypothetical protein
MTGANGDAFLVQDRADVVRMNVVESQTTSTLALFFACR